MKLLKKLTAVTIAATMLASLGVFMVSAAEPEVGENIFTTSGPGQHRAAGLPSGISRAEIIAAIPDVPATGQVIHGSGTHASANILGGWDNPMPNSQMRLLTSGLGTIESNMYREFFPNPLVTRNIEITDNEDGSRTYTITVYTENQFSDGTFVDASHYAGAIALWAHHYWGQIADTASGAFEVVGRDAWFNGEADTFAGVRLYDNETFSVTVGEENLPNVWEIPLYMWWNPTPLHAIIPGHEPVDNGDGVFFDPPLTFDFLNARINGGEVVVEGADGEDVILGDGWRHNPTVSSGPYMFHSFDPATNNLIVTANPYYPGTWDGFRPRIETIIWMRRDSAVHIDAMRLGEFDIMAGVTLGDVINQGLEILVFGDGTHYFETYPRHGYSLVRFHVDHGPTQFVEVRQAAIWLMDRDEVGRLITGGHGTIIQGPYSLSQWFYHAALDRGFYDMITHYVFNPDMAIQVLEEGGWVLNEHGEPFVLGVDDVRYKDISGIELKMDNDLDRTVFGDLMRLEIHWATWHDAGNAVTPILYINFVQEMRAVGMAVVDHRFDNALPHAQRIGGVRSQTEPDLQFHMFNQGLGFNAFTYTPWFQYSTRAEFMGGGFNSWWVYDHELENLARQLMFNDLNTDEGRYDFVTAWMDLQVELNSLVLDIPIVANIEHDFVANRVQGWHNTSIWGFSPSILRSYTVD